MPRIKMNLQSAVSVDPERIGGDRRVEVVDTTTGARRRAFPVDAREQIATGAACWPEDYKPGKSGGGAPDGGDAGTAPESEAVQGAGSEKKPGSSKPSTVAGDGDDRPAGKGGRGRG